MIAPYGDIFVVESCEGRIQIFQPDGTYIRQLEGFGREGRGRMKRERQWGETHTESRCPSATYAGVERLTRRLLDIGDVALYTGLSVHTLYTMVSQRRIPFVKMGRLTKFDLRAIDEWIAKHSVSPMKPLQFS